MMKNSSAFSIETRTSIVVVACAFFSEFFIMRALDGISLQANIKTLIDAISLSIILFIALRFFIVKPAKKDLLESQNLVSLYEKRMESLNRSAIISVGDHAGNITDLNENFEKISGFSRKELLGKNHRIVNSGYHSKELFKNMWVTIKSGQVWRGQVKNKKKNGDFYWVDATIAPVYDKENNIKEFISLRYEITDLKNAEEALDREKMKNVLDGRLAALGEMATSIAHEINNPLAIIKANSSRIRKKILESPLDEQKINESLKSIDETVQRVARIIKDVRGFSEDTNNAAFDFGKTTEIIDSALNLCREKLNSAGIEIKLNLQEVEFKCKSIQLEQALYALIKNAIEAVEDLAEKWIEITARQDGNTLEISIQDSGPGIPEDLRNKIMSPFFTTKGVGQGTGLGLSMAKSIIESHGGRVLIDTKAKNTCFVIQLPMFTETLSVLDIQDAIEAHLKWKQKLSLYFAKCDKTLNSEEIGNDGRCGLGKWLLQRNEKDLDELKIIHTKFHQCVGTIVEKLNNGEQINMIECIGIGSNFEKYSTKIISMLNQLHEKGIK